MHAAWRGRFSIIVTLAGVTKVYPPRSVALQDINLDIERGEFVFLIGPSGAGKSTLMRLLYREERATSGRVSVNGHDLMRMRPSRLPFFRRQIGVLFQDFKLLPDKSVAQNMAFPLIVAEVSPREARRRVGLWLEIVGLRDRARALPAELSGGEQQRAALARAAINNPALLIADEPTGNLDPRTAQDITELLHEINCRGTTVVVATHSVEMVDRMRRRVVEVGGGRIVRDEVRGSYRALEDGVAGAAGRGLAVGVQTRPAAVARVWPGRGSRRG